MTPITVTMRVPRMAEPAPPAVQDPYVALIEAILHRALEDAQGRCAHACAMSPEQIEAEARHWLQDGRGVSELVELVGMDSVPVLRRVHAVLARHSQEREKED